MSRLTGKMGSLYNINELKTVTCRYTYDAWGNILSVTGSMATTLGEYNPLRYRSYVYDTETGFYYLQSRYYNPEIGRFLNADAFASTGQGVLGNNMFAYCRNNPSCRSDISGTADVIAHNDGELLSNDDLDERAKGGGSGSIYNESFKSDYINNANSGPTNPDCIRIGGGHGGAIHNASIEMKMSELQASGDYVAIYGNRALSTAHQNGSWRPDIIAIKNDGSVEVWEYASPSQATGTSGYYKLVGKINDMQAANPDIFFYPIIPWEVCHE